MLIHNTGYPITDIQAEGRGIDAVDPHPGAIGGNRIGVAAVAAIDHGGVVAAEQRVRAGVASQQVVAVFSEQLIRIRCVNTVC